MMTDVITLAGFMLAVFCAGVAVGKIVEKVERYIPGKKMKSMREYTKTTAVRYPTKTS